MIVSLVDSVLHLPPIWLTKGVRTKHAFCVCIVYSRKLETRDLQYSWQCINFSQEVKGYVTIHQHNLSERRSCLTFASLSRSKSYSLTSCSIFYPKQALQNKLPYSRLSTVWIRVSIRLSVLAINLIFILRPQLVTVIKLAHIERLCS